MATVINNPPPGTAPSNDSSASGVGIFIAILIVVMVLAFLFILLAPRGNRGTPAAGTQTESNQNVTDTVLDGDNVVPDSVDVNIKKESQ